MTFDVKGLLIFLLAIIPGFLANQTRSLIVPRTLRTQSALEETGNYVLNSILVHLLLLAGFRLSFALLRSSIPRSLGLAISQNQVSVWGWEHRYLIVLYLVASLACGSVVGVIRGVATRDQVVGGWLADTPWLSRILIRRGVLSFLEEDPVWYEALKQRSRLEHTFVEVRLKNGMGFYTGELKSYGIVPDNSPNKDFLLVNAEYKAAEEDPFQALNVDGVLLNFADAVSLTFIKQ
jgi:uncharacterized protein DUF6338